MQKAWLRPFAPYLASPLVWRFNRRGVARGAALGLFAGFAIPVAQTPFAALFAVAARANLPVAALATFVTNPLTVPFIYYLAYRTGAAVLRAQTGAHLAPRPDGGALEQAISWLITLAGPTLLGLWIFAAIGGLVGYFGVHLGWRLWVLLRRKRRRVHRGGGGKTGEVRA